MRLLECYLVALTLSRVSAVIDDKFPEDFLFGVATSAYQVEGAWNISDKGESIWDRIVHEKPEFIADGSNGDVAADSYHKFKEDIRLVKSINANTYRFSISWSRILPDGFRTRISEDGVRYYNALIDECVDNGITPMITLYHWDLPQKLQDIGGWVHPNITLWFADYADVVFELFGDRVKMWITINEPLVICTRGYIYGGFSYFPPFNQSGSSQLSCIHNILLVHGKVHALYERKYRSKQNGKIGIAFIPIWFEPADNTSRANIAAAEGSFDLTVGLFLHPLFTPEGDYSENVKSVISAMSKRQGANTSRLPQFSSEQIEEIRNSCDFVGINYYAISSLVHKNNSNGRSIDDTKEYSFNFEDWDTRLPTKGSPWGLRKLLQKLTSKFQLPDIYITENGYADGGGLQDVERTTYLHDHLQMLLDIMRDGIDVKGYVVWSLIDNFQWIEGYTSCFGLFEVDFNRSDRPRTPKLSSKYITEVYSTRKIPDLSNFIHSGESTCNSINRIIIYLSFCLIMFIL